MHNSLILHIRYKNSQLLFPKVPSCLPLSGSEQAEVWAACLHRCRHSGGDQVSLQSLCLVARLGFLTYGFSCPVSASRPEVKTCKKPLVTWGSLPIRGAWTPLPTLPLAPLAPCLSQTRHPSDHVSEAQSTPFLHLAPVWVRGSLWCIKCVLNLLGVAKNLTSVALAIVDYYTLRLEGV